MGARLLLARIAGTPFTINDLRPDSALLELASAAVEANHEVLMQDLGSFETFEMLYPPDVRPEALHWVMQMEADEVIERALAEKPEVTRQPESLARLHHTVFGQLGEGLVARSKPDAILFHITNSKDFRVTARVAERALAMHPGIRLMAWMPNLADRYDLIEKGLRCFECISFGRDPRGIVEAATTPDTNRWAEIPNLAYNDGVRLILTTDRAPEPMPPLPSQDQMENFLYIFPASYSKICVFDVRPLEQCSHSRYMEPHRTTEDVPPAELDMIKALSRQYRTAAFYLRGDRAGRRPGPELEHAILSSGLRITYGRELDAAKTAKTHLGLLSAAGCLSVDFQLHSGSQRLLDTYYRSGFTVTHAERLIRAARFSGLFTSAHFTYPCPEDDYHTEEETLRFVRRANPSSVVVNPERRRSIDRPAFEIEAPRETRTGSTREIKARSTLRKRMRQIHPMPNLDGCTALLASIAGFKNCESEFAELVGWQLLSGDATGLAESIERINDGARRPAPRHAFRSYETDRNIAAN